MSTLSQFYGGLTSVVRSVQRGSTTIGGFNATVDVTIAAVNTGKTMVVSSCRSNATPVVGQTDMQYAAVAATSATAHLISPTILRISGYSAAPLSTATITWEVVEFN